MPESCLNNFYFSDIFYFSDLLDPHCSSSHYTDIEVGNVIPPITALATISTFSGKVAAHPNMDHQLLLLLYGGLMLHTARINIPPISPIEPTEFIPLVENSERNALMIPDNRCYPYDNPLIPILNHGKENTQTTATSSYDIIANTAIVLTAVAITSHAFGSGDLSNGIKDSLKTMLAFAITSSLEPALRAINKNIYLYCGLNLKPVIDLAADVISTGKSIFLSLSIRQGMEPLFEHLLVLTTLSDKMPNQVTSSIAKVTAATLSTIPTSLLLKADAAIKNFFAQPDLTFTFKQQDGDISKPQKSDKFTDAICQGIKESTKIIIKEAVPSYFHEIGRATSDTIIKIGKNYIKQEEDITNNIHYTFMENVDRYMIEYLLKRKSGSTLKSLDNMGSIIATTIIKTIAKTASRGYIAKQATVEHH